MSDDDVETIPVRFGRFNHKKDVQLDVQRIARAKYSPEGKRTVTTKKPSKARCPPRRHAGLSG